MPRRGERKLTDKQSAAIRKFLDKNPAASPTEIAEKLGLGYRQVASSGPYRDRLKLKKMADKARSGKFMSRSIAEAVKRAENVERAKEVARIVPEDVGDSSLRRYKRRMAHPAARITLKGLVGRMTTKHEMVKALADEMLADICFLQKIIGK